MVDQWWDMVDQWWDMVGYGGPIVGYGGPVSTNTTCQPFMCGFITVYSSS